MIKELTTTDCNAANTDECFIVLVTVEHNELAAPIRLNTSGENQVSNGDTYLACPIQVTLSEDSEDRIPQAKLVMDMDNIDRTIVAALRSITTPPTVTLQIVKASDPDTVEMELTDFEMRTITYSLVSNASPVTGMAADYLKQLRLSCHLNLLNADADLHRLGAVTSLSGLELRLLDLIEEYLVTNV